MDLSQATAVQIADQVRARKFSAREVALYFLERAKKQNVQNDAFLSLEEGPLLQAAEAVDEKARSGRAGKLAGVPVAVKDNICVAGTRTTCASKILKGYIAPYHATVIAKLAAEDALFLGKTNLDEFAMGSSTENSAYATTKNPWDLERVPGGSSGGSAAAVAGRMAPLALGSDTGGSIRQPASFCGVLGLKPTYGRVSRYGLVAFASSLDQIGPFATGAEDCALILGVIAGHDPKDSTSSEAAVDDYPARIREPVRGTRIGIPKEYFVSGLDPAVKESVLKAADVLAQGGAEVQEVCLPHTSYAIEVYYILAPSEASSNLARFDGMRYGHRAAQAGTLAEQYERSRDEGFGPEVKRRIMLGTYALSSGYYDAYYAKAQKVRTLIRRDFEQAFEKVDALLTPTAPTPAFKIGEKASDPLEMYLSDIFTISCNLAGVPGISVPCGFSKDGLPIGFQLLGRPFEESTLLRLSAFYQSQTDWHRRLPPTA